LDSRRKKEMSKSKDSASATSRVSYFVLLVIFVTLALSFTALILAINYFSHNQVTAYYLLLIGFLGAALSAYVLLQTRRKMKRLRIETPPVTTTVECKKCGFKNVREFKREDYVFKEVEPCQKCDENMLITAIYREVKKGSKKIRS
jgi:hypothetical protein